MLLRVGEGEGRAPAAAEDEVPFWDREVLAKGFDVGDEVPGCVVGHGGVGAGFPAAALVEEDDAVGGGGEEGGVGFGAVAAGAAVEEDGWVGGLEGGKGIGEMG